MLSLWSLKHHSEIQTEELAHCAARPWPECLWVSVLVKSHRNNFHTSWLHYLRQSEAPGGRSLPFWQPWTRLPNPHHVAADSFPSHDSQRGAVDFDLLGGRQPTLPFAAGGDKQSRLIKKTTRTKTIRPSAAPPLPYSIDRYFPHSWLTPGLEALC